MWHIYAMEHYLAIERKEIVSFVETWIDLEIVIQSEVSQKEKNKYCILIHIYGIQKNGTDEPICRAGIEIQTQRIYMWTQGANEGWDELRGDIDIYTPPCVKQIASGNLLYNTGNSAWCSVMTQRDGKGGGRRSKRGEIYAYIQLIHFIVQQKLTHCKTTIPQLKKEKLSLGSGARFIIEKEWLLIQASKGNLKVLLLGTLCSSYSSRENEAGAQCVCGMWLHIPTFPPGTTAPTKNQSIFRLHWVT